MDTASTCSVGTFGVRIGKQAYGEFGFDETFEMLTASEGHDLVMCNSEYDLQFNDEYQRVTVAMCMHND